MRLTGTTRLAVVIGRPVRHSLSPVLHNAAFAATGLDWVYVALEVGAGRGAAAMDAVRTLGIAGVSVTMPLKAEVAAAVDRLGPSAEALGAVNCVVATDGELTGHNTDGGGLLSALAADPGFDPRGSSCVVVGAGGAARAVILALALAGAEVVTVVNRDPGRAARAAGLAGAAGRVGRVSDIAGADLVVQATPLGMDPRRDPLPFPADLMAPGQILADLIYHPGETPLMAAVRARGVTAVNGSGMLLHQAALAFELWTGETAPLDAMAGALAAGIRPREPQP